MSQRVDQTGIGAEADMDGRTADIAAGSPDTVSRTALNCLIEIAHRLGIADASDKLAQADALKGGPVSPDDLVKCAADLGCKARSFTAGWRDLVKLRRRLPVIIRLKNGYCMNLIWIASTEASEAVVLQDPSAGDQSALTMDRARFEAAWDGTVITVARKHDLLDEDQAFSFRFLIAVILRERKTLRVVLVSALLLGVLALAPIMFFRLLSYRVMIYKSLDTLFVLCAGFAFLIVFEIAFSALRRHLMLHISKRVEVRLLTYVFDKVLNLPIDYFERTPVGLIAHNMREVFDIRSDLSGPVIYTMMDCLTLVIFVPVMFYYNPMLSLLVLGICAAIGAWTLYMLPKFREKSGAVSRAEGAMGSFLIQSLQGIRTIKSLALDAHQRHHWRRLVTNVARLRLEEGNVANTIESVTLVLERLVISGTLAVGVYIAMTANEAVYMGTLFAFVLLAMRASAPLLQLTHLMSKIDKLMSSVDVVSALVNQAPEEGRSGNGLRTPLQGNIEFRNVRFKYKGSPVFALNDVSFKIPQGTSLGIMGRSGSGKTTVTRLLQRLHSEYDGTVTIDGIDIRAYDLDYLRRNLGVVLQDNFLFSGSIRENITIAKPDASFQDVVLAARMAGAEEFIDKLPRGYETHIDEGASNLSGGQRQRLAIARALITNPKILIMDEATSALDAESEAIVNRNLGQIANGRSLIVISHRLSSLVSSDAILVLERGKVNDIGTHAELLQRNEIYSHLWGTQNNNVTSNIIPLRAPR